MTPNSGVTTKRLQAQSNDFVLNNQHLLWLLSQKEFYKDCPAFQQLLKPVIELSEFMAKKGLTSTEKLPGCTNCDKMKARKAQIQIIDGFAKIFIHLHDSGRIEQLRKVLEFVRRTKMKNAARLILAYVGPATKRKERYLLVD